ncbi:regulator of G-protein signaling 14 [Rhinophrynus dorsalis]
MLGKMKYLDVPNGRMVLAVSDGELNNTDLDGRGSDQSLNSLPSVQTAGITSERSVATWAVSFERLLQDPLGIEYFTEFLNKEYSAENIHFWKACEKFQAIAADDSEQLLQESQWIYNEYLSSSSLSPVNVDHQVVITEDMLKAPNPDMFKAQQLQIFNLMKFDSYARFVKSPLYQECMLAEVEGRPLPNITFSSTSIAARCSSFTSGAVKKKKLRAGKSLPIGVEATGMDNATDNCSRSSRRSFKKKDRRAQYKESSDSNGLSSRRESQVSLNSNTSLELSVVSSLSSKSETDAGSLSSAEPETDNKPIKYCCVYLPDGTASLTAVKPGLSIRDMLTGVCEKRGYCPTDVKVFLVGNEQKALALDQECLVLTNQEVRLENRISFELQIDPINKSVRIVAKSTKTLGEALHPVLKKYGLENQQVILTKTAAGVTDAAAAAGGQLNYSLAGRHVMESLPADDAPRLGDLPPERDEKDDVKNMEKEQSHYRWIPKVGESESVDQGCSVNDFAGKKLILEEIMETKDIKNTTEYTGEKQIKKDPAKEKTEEITTPGLVHHQGAQVTDNVNQLPSAYRHGGAQQMKYKSHRHTYDIEGLVELLNKVQSSRAEDQRGLLRKEDLVLPEFLRLPTEDQCDNSLVICQHNVSEVTNILPSCPDMLKAHEHFSEDIRYTNTRLTMPEIQSSSDSHSQTVNGLAVSPDGTHANKDTTPPVTISDLNSLHPTSDENKMCTEDKNSV